MPTVYDRWATEQPFAATKYADVSVKRIVTEADKEERLTPISRIKEITVQFVYRQKPLRPECFMISFTGNQKDAIAVDFTEGAEVVFRASNTPHLATSRFFTLFVNKVSPTLFTADSVSYTIRNGIKPEGPVYTKSMTSIVPRITNEQITGFYSTWTNMNNELYSGGPDTRIQLSVYQREGMIQRIERQRIYGYLPNFAVYPFVFTEPQGPQEIYFFSYSSRDAVAKWADALLVFYGEQQNSGGASIPQGTNRGMNVIGYTLLLYPQQVDLSYYGLRPNKNAEYIPATSSGGGTLSTTIIAEHGDFWAR